MDLRESTIQAMAELDETVLMECVDKLRDENIDHHQIEKLLQEGMRGVGSRFETGEYFLADLIVSGVLFREVMEKIRVENNDCFEGEPLGKVLLGVMEGDIHDIGKDIVCQTLQTEGFQVIDLGVDVSAECFLKAAQEYEPDIIVLSGIMGFSVDKMQKVIKLFEEKEVRQNYKMIVGGSCINYETSVSIGADGYAEDPLDNAALCKKIMEMHKDHE